MKTYTTLEAIKMLSQNNKSKFTDRQGRLLINDKNVLTCLFQHDVSCINLNIDLEEKWMLKEEPVTFMEAINSGKRIRYSLWINFHSLKDTIDIFSGSYEISIQDMINGKWFIEDGGIDE